MKLIDRWRPKQSHTAINKAVDAVVVPAEMIEWRIFYVANATGHL